jgi:general stress protein YciG
MTTENSNNDHKKGFASMDKERVREIARKGGLAISQNKKYMSIIGKKGGKASVKSKYKKNQLLN